jgi:hypothetical protein
VKRIPPVSTPGCERLREIGLAIDYSTELAPCGVSPSAQGALASLLAFRPEVLEGEAPQVRDRGKHDALGGELLNWDAL